MDQPFHRHRPLRVRPPLVLLLVIVSALLAVAVGCGGKVTEFTAGDPSLAADLPSMSFAAADWPYWRGQGLRGHADGSATIDPEGLKVIWKQAVGYEGHASPILFGSSVFVAGADREKEVQYLLAFDREDGRPLWETKLHEGGFMYVHAKNSQASATPACDGKRLFAVCMVQDGVWLSAVDLDGKLLWQKQAGPFRSQHGYGSSPVLYQSLVIVAGDSAAGGFLTAFHRETGEVVWRVRRSSSPSFCTPVIAQVAGKTQLLMSGRNKVHSYDPATGKTLWSARGPAKTTANSIVWSDDLVFASGGYPERKIMAIKADGSGEVVWENNKKVYVPSMLVANDMLFAVQDNGVAHCYRTATGEELWNERLSGDYSSSPTLVGDRIFIVSERGDLTVFSAAEEFKRISKQPLDGSCYATPAIVGNRMYVRTPQELICYGN